MFLWLFRWLYIFIMYEFHHGKNASEAARLINQIYPYSVDVWKCERWFSRFKVGNFYLSNAPKSGRSPTVDTVIIQTFIEKDSCQTLVAMSSQLGINKKTIRISIKKMNKKSNTGIWGPHDLFDDPKKKHVSICKILISKQKWRLVTRNRLFMTTAVVKHHGFHPAKTYNHCKTKYSWGKGYVKCLVVHQIYHPFRASATWWNNNRRNVLCSVREIERQNWKKEASFGIQKWSHHSSG